MSFIITKALSTLLFPLFTSIVMITIGTLLRRYRAKLGYFLVVAGLAYLYICSTNRFADWLARTIESDYQYVQPSEIAKADAVIVLGGGVRHSQGVLELGSSADRILQGARLIRAEVSPTIIVTSGATYGSTPHSIAMSEFLHDLGIDGDKIIEENQAQTTYEHTVYLKPILEDHDIQSFILVTSAWHMRRSIAVFESQLPEYKITAFPVDSLKGRTYSIVDYLPKSDALMDSSAIIKEYVGYVVYDLKNWIQ